MNKEDLLNWDHDINPTPIADLEAAVRIHLHKRLPSCTVELTKDELVVKNTVTAIFARDASFGTTVDPHVVTVLHLVLDGKYYRDVTGRVRFFFTYEEELMLTEAVKAAPPQEAA